MLKNWITIFLYHIKNNKLFTALNVLGLSIGIAGLIFATLYWNDEQSYNAWNPYKDRVFQSINKVSKEDYWANSVAPLNNYLKDFPEVEAYCYVNNWYNEEVVQYENKKEILKLIGSQKDYFEMFPFQFIKGSPKNVLSDNNSIAISSETAQKFFGNENPMGKYITISNAKFMVRGVYVIPGKSSSAPDGVFRDLEAIIKNGADDWGNFSYGLLIKTKKPTDKAKVEAKVEKIMFEHRVVNEAKKAGLSVDEFLKQNGSDEYQYILDPLKDAHLHEIAESYPESKGNYQFLLIMVGLSILILILSIVNYINLATANAIKRAKEVGVRKIIGASRSNIILQFIFETVLLAFFSILLALVIVELSLPYYNDLLNKKLLIFGSQFYLQLLLIFVVVIVFAGILPALYVSNFETLKVLKGNFSRSKSGIWLRNGMLVLQFAIATFFIIGSYIVYQQVDYLNKKDLGFKGDQIISISYRNNYDWKDKNYKQKILSKYMMVKSELSKIKGVNQVATGAFKMGTGNGSTSGFTYKNSDLIQGRNMGIDFGMLEMMHVQIKEGRMLSSKIASDTIDSMLINETTWHMMNEPNPIGKVVHWNDRNLKIVGVVKDFHLLGPQEKIPPMVFFHFKTIDWVLQNSNTINVQLDTQDLDKTLADIEKFWTKNVDTEYPFEYEFMDKQYARTYREYVNQKNLFSLLNIVVIGIALFGLFALASYSIQRRMKEIAIRKTLGAETNVLLKELSKQYIVFCLIGFSIALFPVYYLLNMWLENFAFRIDISIIPFIVGFVVLLILTLIVVLSRAYQATRVDVLKYLKYE